MTTVPIQRLQHPDSRAAAVLGRAFWDDPLTQHIAPSESQRRRLANLFDITLRYGVLFGEVYSTPDVRGVAIWIPPRNFQITLGRSLRVGLWRLPLAVGLPPLVRLMRAMFAMDHLHARDVAPDHWYLFYLGVDPPHQGQGLGAALLQPVLERATQAGQPCYLETTNPRNLSFYRRCGFEVVSDVVLPGGVPCKTMRHGT